MQLILGLAWGWLGACRVPPVDGASPAWRGHGHRVRLLQRAGADDHVPVLQGQAASHVPAHHKMRINCHGTAVELNYLIMCASCRDRLRPMSLHIQDLKDTAKCPPKKAAGNSPSRKKTHVGQFLAKLGLRLLQRAGLDDHVPVLQ